MIVDKLRERAKQNPRRIVYPEGTEPRILKAIDEILKEKIAKPILLGKKEEIEAKAKELGVNIDGVEFIDPMNSDKREEYSQKLYELRKDKLVNLDEARAILEDYIYFGTMMVKEGYADGMISGIIHTTASTVRPALQIIKTRAGVKYASGAMIMEIDGQTFLFADCAIMPEPSAEQLAEIAAASAATMQMLEIEPKIAMLSFSTKGSTQHAHAEKIIKATDIAREKGLHIDGEMQVDAAIDKEVAKIKCPLSEVAGQANVFIFPDLNSGNIGYKLVERFAKAEAVGPILQGLSKPINDLSRGSTVKEVVDLTAYTVVESQIGE